MTKGTDDASGKHLAELWFGSHPSGPAYVFVGKHHIKLSEFLTKSPEMVGSIELYHKYSKTLPFLFKILSVAQPLSLQAHPDKRLAEVLHQRDQKNYPDSNHKPELAIALTDFEVLCDFRPHHEIVQFMTAIVPLQHVVGVKNYEQYAKAVSQDDDSEQLRAHLAECFKSLMVCDKETIVGETEKFLAIPSCTAIITNSLLKLVRHIEKLYPGDPGIFAPFFLNYLKLSPGQAIFLRANKLHAYISGECIECMACSDNVVRAGLTTKFRDVDTLLGMLDYEPVKHSQDVLFAGARNPKDAAVVSYHPTDEFKVDKILVTEKDAPNGEYNLASKSSGSFIIVLSGKATAKNFFDFTLDHKLAQGSAGFVPPKIILKLHAIQTPLTIYRAYC